MVLSTGEPAASIAPTIAAQIQIGALPGRGRRVIPSDVGPLIAKLAGLQRMELRAIDGQWIDVTLPALALSYRSQALGVGGLLGNDVLVKFKRLAFALVAHRCSPPDLLVLEGRS